MTYRFFYLNNTFKYRDFDTQQEAYWFAQNEGDHLVYWEPVNVDI